MIYTELQMEEDNKRFKEICDKFVELRTKKGKDYGNSWRILGLPGVVVQVVHKAIRIWNLRNREPENESLRDSFMDIAIYAIMAMMLIDEQGTDPLI